VLFLFFLSFFITPKVVVIFLNFFLKKLSAVVLDEIMSMEWWKNDNDRGNTKYSKKTISH
jgi:hypothetical protein